MRWQSTWPSKDIFHEYALDYAKKVNDMTGGDLRIEVLPAGAVVPAFGLLDAVSKGTLDGGHGVLVYHYGKQNALALWDRVPATPWMPTRCSPGISTAAARSCSTRSTAPSAQTWSRSPMGRCRRSRWVGFKKPITKPDDFKGLKYRTVGISIDLFNGMGAAVNALPGAEIVPAIDRGLLDAAEFNNATSDRILGFPDVSKVCMLQSYHQNGEQFEITFNKTKYDALPARSRRSSRTPWKPLRRHVVEGDQPLLAGLR